MDHDVPGKGEVRMDPVDVDVLDNLINAQAAYLEAWKTVFEHHDIESDKEVISKTRGSLAQASGYAIGLMAALRV